MKAAKFGNYWRVQVSAGKSPTGKRRVIYFQTQKEAEEKIRDIKKRGMLALMDLEEIKARAKLEGDSQYWQHLVETYGLTKEQITKALDREVQISKLNAATVRKAVEEFQRIRAAKVSSASLDSDRYRLLKLINAFEHRQMSEISEADLRRFFDELAAKMNTRSVYKSVRTFFGWAKQYNYIAQNPMLNLKPEHEFGINKGVYTPEEFRRMLNVAAGLEGPKPNKKPSQDFIDMLPWFVLSGFCGLRSCEAYRLEREADAIRWGDLYFDRGFVHIREEIAKSTRRDSDERHIERPYALAAAQAWLNLVPRNGELVVPWTKRHMQELKRRFTKATGIKFVENGFRNSFASYALTYTGLDGVGKLALEMGNSEAIAKRHYIKTLEPGSGQAWFGIRPAPENVISISAAA